MAFMPALREVNDENDEGYSDDVAVGACNLKLEVEAVDHVG